MTLLCLDVSNIRTTIGAFDGDDLVAHWQVSSDDRRTPDEWQLLLTGLVRQSGLRDVEAVSVSCTVPAILEDLRELQERYYADIPVHVVGPGVRTGIAIHTDNPREVGADRIVNSLAAARQYGGPAVVVDLAGTATTFDVIDAAGSYIGGAIAPGLEVSLEALSLRSAQLRSVAISRPRNVIGKNTAEAVQSGAVFGFASLVDGMVERIADSMDVDLDELTVIATGAHSRDVLDECSAITDRDPFLTLTGLRLVHEMNT